MVPAELRVLSAIAALGASGCSCFDSAYEAFCDGGRCDPAEVRFLNTPAVIDAMDCFRLTLGTVDRQGKKVMPRSPLPVLLTSNRAETLFIYRGSTCGEPMDQEFPMVTSEEQLSARVRGFGRVSLSVSSPALDGGQHVVHIPSRALLAAEPAGLHVGPSGCWGDGGMLRVRSEAISGSGEEVPALLDTEFSVSFPPGNNLHALTDAGTCSHRFKLLMTTGSANAEFRVAAGVDGGAAELSVDPNDAGYFVNSNFIARVSSREIPLGGDCADLDPCATGSTCISGRCCRAVGDGCQLRTDCCSLRCSTGNTCLP